MKFLLFSFLLVVSVEVSAKNRVQVLLEEKGEKSAYEILADFHSQSNTPVDIDEINTYDLDAADEIKKFVSCAYARPDTVMPILEDLRVFTKVKVIPGIPSRGPLFPGKPEKRIPQFGLALGFLNGQAQEEVLETAVWAKVTDRTVYAHEAGLGGSDYDYAVIKKNGDLLSFYMQNTIYPSLKIFGYCWN